VSWHIAGSGAEPHGSEVAISSIFVSAIGELA